ncbi:MAG: glycosyltransferase [Candidatus Eisenbacteria bacterium]|nr:glycosyltransferase [Candidatus Eisenbacteria bacterium]
MTEKLRVVMGTVYPYDESRIRGGVEAVAFYLTQALAKRDDLELHVVSCNRTLHPHVVHAQGFSEYALAASSRDCLLLAVHGVEAMVPHMRNIAHYQGATGAYRRWIAPWIAAQSIRNARGIISNAGGYITDLLAGQLAGKAVYSVFNPVADDFFELGNGQADPSPIILWVGNISERKDVVGLIQAFASVSRHVPQARLRIVGGNSEPMYFERVKREIVNCGLEAVVDLVGRIEQTSLLKEYSAAMVVALSSIEETAPMAVAQAMAAGKAVVSTRVGGTPWMVEDGVTGCLVDVGDISGMTDRMLELLQNKDKRERMGRAARQTALERFSADGVAEKTAQAYRDLFERRRQG